MDTKPGVITLEDFIDELARVLHESESARELVLRVRFPAAELPLFDVPRVFWSRVIRAAADGKLVGGVRALVDEVAKRYPGNEVLAGYRAQAVGAAQGREPGGSGVEASSVFVATTTSTTQHRACGRTQAAGKSAAAADGYDVFLSHSSADEPAVEEIAMRLRDEAGLRPFFYRWALVPGEPWMPALERAIKRSTAVAVFFGPQGRGAWHDQESQLALALAAEEHGRRVIPVLLPGARKEDVGGFMRLRMWVELGKVDGFERLVAGIVGRTPGTPGTCARPPSGPSIELSLEPSPHQYAGNGAPMVMATRASGTNRSPVVVEHLVAKGMLNGAEVSASTLASTALLLVARGANQLLVPAPHDRDREVAENARLMLPSQRRAMVKLVDVRGRLFSRVHDYIGPLGEQAVEWPETAFVRYAADFLYRQALGQKYRSSIISEAPSVARSFLPIIRPETFTGEARFRLAELARLLCEYQPAVVENMMLRSEVPIGASQSALEIMEYAECAELVARTGRLGYLRKPIVALRALRRCVVRLFCRPKVGQLLRIANIAVDAASAAPPSSELGALIRESHSTTGLDSFRPPFFELGPAALALYRHALSQTAHGAAPPAGTVMLLEHRLGGTVSVSWLNEGEEDKLHQDAINGCEVRRREWAKAKRATSMLLGCL